MKRILSLSLILLLSLVVLVGCSGEQTATNEEAKGEVDAVTTASITGDEEIFARTIGKKGTWIIATLNDLTFDEELVVEGEFHNKGDASKELYRKLAPYAQDDNHKVTERYTITAPKLTIKSPNTKLQGGIFVGDVYVESNGFIIKDAKVDGNIYFAKEEYQASFDMSDRGEVTGATAVRPDLDTVSSASLTAEADVFARTVGKEGTWIIAALNDLTFDYAVVIEGEFHNKGDASKELYRKLAPYAQDENHKVTERYTLTAPKFIVKSPNTKFQGGIFAGDVYVQADGFTIQDAKVEGNVYFASQEFKSSFDMSNKGQVTGVIEVK